jgi:hypothetical protein
MVYEFRSRLLLKVVPVFICGKAVATSTCWIGDLIGCRVDVDTVQREVAV